MKRSPPPSKEALLERFAYDPESGVFTWKITPPHTRVKPGDIAGTTDASGYRRLNVGHEPVLAHRVAWLFVHGRWPEKYIDHANGNRADNRIANLRECDARLNQANKGLMCSNTSGVKGVYWDRDRKRWRAAIRAFGKKVSLGSFTSKEAAAAVYRQKAIELHGEFVNFN